MGWGRWLLLGNLGQQLDIQEQRKQIQALSSRVRSESSRTDQSIELRLDILERNCDEIKLYLATLVRYLSAKGTIAISEFEELVDEIDQEDGSANGRYKGKFL